MVFILILTPAIWIDNAHAGSSFNTLTQATNVVKVNNTKERDYILRQTRISRVKKNKVVPLNMGASVFCGSQVVK